MQPWANVAATRLYLLVAAGILVWLAGQRVIGFLAPKLATTLAVHRWLEPFPAQSVSIPATDPWGSRIRVAPVGSAMVVKNSELFYSCGPNAIDEQGQGDDFFCYESGFPILVTIAAQYERIALFVAFLSAIVLGTARLRTQRALLLAAISGSVTGGILSANLPGFLFAGPAGGGLSQVASGACISAVLSSACVVLFGVVEFKPVGFQKSAESESPVPSP